MRRLLLLLLLIFSANLFAADKIVVLTIDGAIGPATQDYIVRNIRKAEKENANLVLIKINTPGGLETTMRAINEKIISATLPIVTYVTPAGARAASAGTFILYASHIAAMAPGTNIGAASPINLLSSGGQNKELSTSEKKAVNDAAAYIRSLAQLRGRNIEWGESAVRQASSLSAKEAKEKAVIDVIAVDDQDLLKQINGKAVNVKGGIKNIDTNNVPMVTVERDWRYRFLAFITDPNITYLLLFIALYGIFFELSNPGLVLPGVAGTIALLLLLYAFQLMPVNYVGLSLLILGLIFIFLEFYLSTFGVIGVGGIVAFIIGSVMLFDLEQSYFSVDWHLILLMSLITAAFFVFLVGLAFRSQKRKVVTGKEGLIGSEGVVIQVSDDVILVRIMGEIWEAHAHEPLHLKDRIRVTHVKNLYLTVEPINNKLKI